MTGSAKTTSALLIEVDSVLADGQSAATITPARVRQLLEDFVVTTDVRAPVSIKQFGAVGDGVTDDTAAFVAANAYIQSQSRVDPNSDPSFPQLVGVNIYIPHGEYLITSAKALFNFDFGVLANAPWGIGFEGESAPGSVIVYHPGTAGPLCYNNACAGGLVFRNLQFTCNSATSNFMDSVGPRAQDYVFENCYWMGTWQYGLNLTGTDNNSEMKFMKCHFIGTFTTFLFGNSTTVDQYLNFWFTECSIVNSCNLITSLASGGGGHYNLINCDLSGWLPASDTYVVQLLGTDRSEGVTTFSAINCRMEARNQHALFLKCEWGAGNILLQNCDLGAYAFATGIGFSPFFFNRRGEWGPTIRFDSCMLMGRHEYHYNDLGFANGGPAGTASLGIASVTYQSCQMMQSSVPSDFIISTNDGTSGNVGNSNTFHFRNCTSFATGNPVIWDTDLNWNVSSTGSTSRKIVSPKTITGTFPKSGQGVTIYMPTGAVIVGITWFSNGTGGNTSAFAYRIRSTEGSPTTLDTVSGSNLSLGFSRNTTLFFDCGTTTGRTTLIFDETASQATAPTVAFCCIEYIG